MSVDWPETAPPLAKSVYWASVQVIGTIRTKSFCSYLPASKYSPGELLYASKGTHDLNSLFLSGRICSTSYDRMKREAGVHRRQTGPRRESTEMLHARWHSLCTLSSIDPSFRSGKPSLCWSLLRRFDHTGQNTRSASASPPWRR